MINKIRKIISYIGLYGLYFGVWASVGDLLNTLFNITELSRYWIVILFMILIGVNLLQFKIIILSPYEDKGENK